MLLQCIVGFTNIFSSLFLYFSNSDLSLTLIIAPSAWQRLYHKCGQVYSKPSLRNIKSPWQPLFISFASSACIIYLCQIWSLCYSPRLSLYPLSVTSSFRPFAKLRVNTLCNIYCTVYMTCTNAWKGAKKGTDWDIIVCRLRVKLDDFTNQEVECWRGCLWDWLQKETGVSARQYDLIPLKTRIS